MTAFVVDTNVAIAANGRGTHTHADLCCQSACVKTLKRLVARETIAIDDTNLILDEYRKHWRTHLNSAMSKGVGDEFFMHVFDHQYQVDRVRRVTVTPSEEDRRGFEELPENTFDRSDRKFLAVAVAAKAVVLNAMDSDWGEHKALMDELGVEVNELCPQHVARRGGRRQRP